MQVYEEPETGMGGPGSTRWRDYEARPRVEHAPLRLSARVLGRLEPGTQGTLTIRRGDVPVAEASFRAEALGSHRLLTLELRVVWRDGIPPKPQQIRLMPRPVPRGGLRWVARCPECQERRAVYLFVPPGGTRLACRRCCGLLYRSSQRSDPRISRLRQDPERLRLALTSPRLRERFLASMVCLNETDRLTRRPRRRDTRRRFKALRLLDPVVAAATPGFTCN